MQAVGLERLPYLLALIRTFQRGLLMWQGDGWSGHRHGDISDRFACLEVLEDIN